MGDYMTADTFAAILEAAKTLELDLATIRAARTLFNLAYLKGKCDGLAEKCAGQVDNQRKG